MPQPAYAVDAEAAVRDLVNGLHAGITGKGNPLPLGAFLQRVQSPTGAYAVVELISYTPPPDESAIGQARVSAQLWARTKQAAAAAAVAYANALAEHDGRPVQLGTARLWAVTDVSGPLTVGSPAGETEQRYLVDATFHLEPV